MHEEDALAELDDAFLGGASVYDIGEIDTEEK
jgi:hypothetical protein